MDLHSTTILASTKIATTGLFKYCTVDMRVGTLEPDLGYLQSIAICPGFGWCKGVGLVIISFRLVIICTPPDLLDSDQVPDSLEVVLHLFIAKVRRGPGECLIRLAFEDFQQNRVSFRAEIFAKFAITYAFQPLFQGIPGCMAKSTV